MQKLKYGKSKVKPIQKKEAAFKGSQVEKENKLQNFHKDPYSSASLRVKIQNFASKEIPEVNIAQVRKALEQMKNRKAPTNVLPMKGPVSWKMLISK